MLRLCPQKVLSEVLDRPPESPMRAPASSTWAHQHHRKNDMRFSTRQEAALRPGRNRPRGASTERQRSWLRQRFRWSAGLMRVPRDVGNWKKTQKHKRFISGVASDMFFTCRNQDGIARLEREFAAIGGSDALSRQNINALFNVMVLMPAARYVAWLG